MRSILGLFTARYVVTLCEVAYLRIIIIMYTSQKTKQCVPGLPMAILLKTLKHIYALSICLSC